MDDNHIQNVCVYAMQSIEIVTLESMKFSKRLEFKSSCHMIFKENLMIHCFCYKTYTVSADKWTKTEQCHSQNLINSPLWIWLQQTFVLKAEIPSKNLLISDHWKDRKYVARFVHYPSKQLPEHIPNRKIYTELCFNNDGEYFERHLVFL